MKKSEVKEAIHGALKPVLTPSEYRLKKSEGLFVRRIADGTQTLWMPLWDYNPRFDFSLSMSIRLEAAEEITNLFSGSPPKYHAETQTILTQLEHLGVSRRRWRAENESELAANLLELSSVVRDRVIPFFQRYQDLPTIARAANPEVVPIISPLPNGPTTGGGLLADRAAFSSGNQPYRAMSAITLAHLAGLKDFEALVERSRAELPPFPQATEREKFEKLVQHLRERAPETRSTGKP